MTRNRSFRGSQRIRRRMAISIHAGNFLYCAEWQSACGLLKTAEFKELTRMAIDIHSFRQQWGGSSR